MAPRPRITSRSCTTKKYKVPGLFDVWDHPIKPRDLTSGVYRGGRRPLDIYRRIHAGIKGTPMPPFGAALKEEEIAISSTTR